MKISERVSTEQLWRRSQCAAAVLCSVADVDSISQFSKNVLAEVVVPAQHI